MSSAPSVALTNVNVELDSNVAEGVMTYTNNGRQTLQATLAAGSARFHALSSRPIRLLASGARDWNRQLFDLDALNADRSRHAAVGGEGDGRLLEARPHRARRQSARRRAGALDRRSADLWRHRQGLVRRSRAPTRSPTSRRSSSSPTSTCRPAPAICSGSRKLIRPRQSQRLAGGLRLEPVRPGAVARRHRDADRPRRRDHRLQCRATAEAAGAPAAVRRRQFPLRLDARSTS